MTPEQRFDRLERIVKLMIKAGLRARRNAREQDEKITLIINAQIKNEERFDQMATAQANLANSQAHTDQRLDALINIIRKQTERPEF
ncbi:MAG TPA: hypothetical protein VIB00_08745 [Pyrinomonadaceae bacterium]|jgi:hypothetical protein